ncbi:AAA domain-containing protein [Pilobolus umbonatus]|nr:AAA domain-containing protein [Pilobolus umbonatus]
MAPKLPNILVTGTPGTGKTTTSEMIAEATGLQHINVGEVVKSKKCYTQYLEEYDTHELDEDKVYKKIQTDMVKEGGKVVDFHTCEIFPESWFDLVIVLRADTNYLYDRMQKRGYNKRKLDENMECEIMQIVLEKAHESYDPAMIVELISNTVDDMESNVDRVKLWLDHWKSQHTE